MSSCSEWKRVNGETSAPKSRNPPAKGAHPKRKARSFRNGGWIGRPATYHPEKKFSAKNLKQTPRISDGQNRKRQRQRKWIMNLATWNVQGINTKYNEVFQELEKMKTSICVLTETKKKGKGSERIGEYVNFYSGVNKSERAKRGVSIAVHSSLVAKITSWEEVDERIITMDLKINGHEVTIVGVYGPTNDADDQNKDAFFEKLTNVIYNIKQRREIIIMGDLNARTGREPNSSVVGQYGEEIKNDNGQRLIDVCEGLSLKIMNGFFQHKMIHQFTWTQPTRGLKSIIDYVIMRQSTNLKVMDVKAVRGPECGSDHHMVRTRILFSYRSSRAALNRTIENRVDAPRWNIGSLRQESVKFLYKLRLANKIASKIDNRESVSAIYQKVKGCIEEAAAEALGKADAKKERNGEWWEERISKLVAEKKRLYHVWLNTRNIEDHREYARLSREVKKQVAKAKNEAWERKCELIGRCMGGTKVSEAWRSIKSLRRNVKKNHIPLISMSEWRQHYTELLTERRQEFELNWMERQQVPVTGGTTEDISVIEVRKTLTEMKNGKAPGPGNIPIELVKNGPDTLLEILTAVFNHCLKHPDDIPEEWNLAYLSSIHKKGNKKDCANYRGISVTDSIGRLYGRIIRKRIEAYVEDTEEQSGFRAGRSCLDNIYTLRQVLDKRRARNRSTHLVFVDLEKAYDSVPLVKLFEVLDNTGIPKQYVRWIEHYYKNARCAIKVGGRVSQPFGISKGLKQGCCLSPTLFKIYLKEAVRMWSRKCSGMGIEVEGARLFTLFFADDQVVIANDREDMEYMIRKLKEEYDKWGLSMNIAKTEYLVVGEEGEDLRVEGMTIKICAQYKYLGAIISSDGTNEEDVRNKINNGRVAVQALNPLLWSSKLTKKVKADLYRAITEPITTYGAEAWQLSKRNEERLRVVEMDHLRRSARISRLEHIPNGRIREIMQAKNTITDRIQTRQLVWYGHVRRMEADRWPNRAFRYQPPYRRRRGRPRRSWMDGVARAMEERQLQEGDWEDRDEWRRRCEKRNSP